MKNWLKRISRGLICIFSLFYVTSFPVLALEEEQPIKKSGELRFKIERIGGTDRSDENHKNIETEQEKIFPDLFHNDTSTAIQLKQEANDEYMKELGQLIFETPSSPDTALNAMKQSLFSSDYEAPKMVASSTDNTNASTTGPMNKRIFAGLTGLIGMLSIGAYTLLQKLSG